MNNVDPNDREYDIVLHTSVTLMDGRTSTHIDHARSYGRNAEEARERAVRAQKKWLPNACVVAGGATWLNRPNGAPEEGAEEETTMPTKTKTTKTAKTDKTAKTKTEKPKREKVPAADLMTFAVRLPKTESAAFHAACGKGGASRVARALFAAFVAGDSKAFEALVKEAAEANKAA